MRLEKWQIGVISLFIIAIVIGLIWYFALPSSENTSGTQETEEQSEATGQSSNSEIYFSESAKVMYFYSDYCHWCIEEKKVLEELGQEGYTVKPMNIGKNISLAEKYQVEGTPTFVSDSGEKLIGYQNKESLKAFLDKYK